MEGTDGDGWISTEFGCLIWVAIGDGANCCVASAEFVGIGEHVFFAGGKVVEGSEEIFDSQVASGVSSS